MAYKYLFGPVPSRRLGISLGVDLVPFKTCTLNCVYCECGPTTYLTSERKEYVPFDEVMNELDDCLSLSPSLDFITFSGSGEPTLNIRIGDIIDLVKQKYPEYRIAVLTNGTLLSDVKLRDGLMKANLILPSLDATSEELFNKINRPCKEINAKDAVSGLIELRKEYSGEIWLEVFIIPELNDVPEEIHQLKSAIQEIKPDRIQLNTLDRPGSEKWVVPATKDGMEKIASYLGNAEIIADFSSRREVKSFDRSIEDAILSTTRRRPCTAADLSAILGLHINEVNKYIQALIESGSIKIDVQERGVFYSIKPASD